MLSDVTKDRYAEALKTTGGDWTGAAILVLADTVRSIGEGEITLKVENEGDPVKTIADRVLQELRRPPTLDGPRHGTSSGMTVPVC